MLQTSDPLQYTPAEEGAWNDNAEGSCDLMEDTGGTPLYPDQGAPWAPVPDSAALPWGTWGGWPETWACGVAPPPDWVGNMYGTADEAATYAGGPPGQGLNCSLPGWMLAGGWEAAPDGCQWWTPDSPWCGGAPLVGCPRGPPRAGKSHVYVPRRLNLVEQYKERSTASDVTTLMIRNVPNQYHRQQLMQELDELGFRDKYDFVYLPIDNATKWNVGYAFVNFDHPNEAERCMSVLEGHEFFRNRHGKRRIAHVSPAHIQGLEANLRHYSGTSVVSLQPHWHQPWVRRLAARQTRPSSNGHDMGKKLEDALECNQGCLSSGPCMPCSFGGLGGFGGCVANSPGEDSSNSWQAPGGPCSRGRRQLHLDKVMQMRYDDNSLQLRPGPHEPQAPAADWPRSPLMVPCRAAPGSPSSSSQVACGPSPNSPASVPCPHNPMSEGAGHACPRGVDWLPPLEEATDEPPRRAARDGLQVPQVVSRTPSGSPRGRTFGK